MCQQLIFLQPRVLKIAQGFAHVARFQTDEQCALLAACPLFLQRRPLRKESKAR